MTQWSPPRLLSRWPAPRRCTPRWARNREMLLAPPTAAPNRILRRTLPRDSRPGLTRFRYCRMMHRELQTRSSYPACSSVIARILTRHRGHGNTPGLAHPAGRVKDVVLIPLATVAFRCTVRYAKFPRIVNIPQIRLSFTRQGGGPERLVELFSGRGGVDLLDGGDTAVLGFKAGLAWLFPTRHRDSLVGFLGWLGLGHGILE